MHVYSRINKAEEEGTSVVDVDDSYLYRKYKKLAGSGKDVVQPDHPSPPLSGWQIVNENTCKDINHQFHWSLQVHLQYDN